jgi:membrane protease YdiL (CAAX protease family)
VRKSLLHFAVFLGWNVAISVVLLLSVRPERSALESAVGLAVMLLIAIGVIRFYLLRTGTHAEGERAVELRLRPLDRDVTRWVLAAAPVLLLFSWSLGEVYVRLVPVPLHALDPFGQLFVDARGRLMLAILAVGIAPLLEEFFFRGLIQNTLERRWGATVGILGAAGLFALAHFLPWIFPLHLILGAAFGFAVWATGSIWAGVILHAANNAVALAAMGLQGEEASMVPTVWEGGPDADLATAVLLLLVSAALMIWTGGRLLSAARAPRLRRSGSVG